MTSLNAVTSVSTMDSSFVKDRSNPDKWRINDLKGIVIKSLNPFFNNVFYCESGQAPDVR